MIGVKRILTLYLTTLILLVEIYLIDQELNIIWVLRQINIKTSIEKFSIYLSLLFTYY